LLFLLFVLHIYLQVSFAVVTHVVAVVVVRCLLSNVKWSWRWPSLHRYTHIDKDIFIWFILSHVIFFAFKTNDLSNELDSGILCVVW